MEFREIKFPIEDSFFNIPLAHVHVLYKINIDDCTVEFLSCNLTGLSSILILGFEIKCRAGNPQKANKGANQSECCLNVLVNVVQVLGIALGNYGNFGFKRSCGQMSSTLCINCCLKDGEIEIKEKGETQNVKVPVIGPMAGLALLPLYYFIKMIFPELF